MYCRHSKVVNVNQVAVRKIVCMLSGRHSVKKGGNFATRIVLPKFTFQRQHSSHSEIITLALI